MSFSLVVLVPVRINSALDACDTSDIYWIRKCCKTLSGVLQSPQNSASWQHLLQHHVELSVHLWTWFAGRSPKRGSWYSRAHHHTSSSVTESPHLYREALQGPWPVRKRFNKDHEQRERWPGWWVEGTTTMTWMVIEADCQSSFHCVFMSTGGKSDHMWHCDENCGDGWLKKSAWTGQPWWISILGNILSTADLQHKLGGGMLLTAIGFVLDAHILKEATWYCVTESQSCLCD